MDDTAIIRTYGKKNLPDGTTDRPLVTFAVFAYNQEKYIREAVEDAFAQTYSPLEIILSDDCSSDGTFEIMKQMACEYRGPHRVLVRQSELNFGTALHVSAVAKMACGELLVVAAGDDVSFPHRVEMLVEKWLKSNKEPVLLHSAMIQVSEECPEARRTLYIKDDNKVNLECYLSGNPLPFLPPTFAYSKILFSQFPPMIGGSIIEDGPLMFRALLMGPIAGVEEPLVLGRVLKRSSGRGYRISNHERWNLFVLSRIISSVTQLRDLVHVSAIDDDLKVRLEKNLIRTVRALASSIVLPSKAHGKVYRAFKFIYLLFRYPYRAKILHRIANSLMLAVFLEWDSIRRMRRFLSKKPALPEKLEKESLYDA